LANLPWIVAGAALLVAAAALARARRLAKRLERLTESYWDLRYELGQLQARVSRLDPDQAEREAAAQPSVPGAFIPLSSLKR
jgi:hypothetical protein